MSDHGVTHNFYLLDPDSNELELYIDVQPAAQTHRLDLLEILDAFTGRAHRGLTQAQQTIRVWAAGGLRYPQVVGVEAGFL